MTSSYTCLAILCYYRTPTRKLASQFVIAQGRETSSFEWKVDFFLKLSWCTCREETGRLFAHITRHAGNPNKKFEGLEIIIESHALWADTSPDLCGPSWFSFGRTPVLGDFDAEEPRFFFFFAVSDLTSPSRSPHKIFDKSLVTESETFVLLLHGERNMRVEKSCFESDVSLAAAVAGLANDDLSATALADEPPSLHNMIEELKEIKGKF